MAIFYNPMLGFRMSKNLDRTSFDGSERSGHMSSSLSRPPMSPPSSYRRNSYCDPPDTSLHRSSTLDTNAIYTSPKSLQRSSTLDRYVPTRGSYNKEFHEPISVSASDTPVSYNRYSSVTEEIPLDWGFRSLRRRNSKMGTPKLHINDDIKF